MMKTRLLIILSCLVGAGWVRSESTPLFTTDGFKVPQPGHTFDFPRDHGSHPGFKIEWWYLTGHLEREDDSAGRFGFQATFFRQASPDGRSDLFLSHMAMVNVASGEFLHQERLNRPGWDAGAAVGRLAVHNGPWSLVMRDAPGEIMRLVGGVRAEAQWDLQLQPKKPLVIFGENGVSRKGAAPTAASYYLTYSRLAATGTLNWQGESCAVSGLAWMDHEISSSQLGDDQIGWDWISMQLEDQREIMVYQLRKRDGTSDPASSLTWVDAAGAPRRQPFTMKVESTWSSPHNGAQYPAKVRITTTDPASGKSVIVWVEPLVADQELTGDLAGIPYWEGACRVRNESGEIIGKAYMELTGYAKELEL
jgi:predicted secreted hydrolase